MEQKTILKLEHISKFYPGVVALDDVSLELQSGEIHALIGENGAGKSTLIKCISGAIQPEKGSIYVDGNKIDRMNPALSKSLGISVIYQEPNLCQHMTVAENVFLGKEPHNGINLDRKTMNEETKKLLSSLGMDFDPDTKVSTLSAAYKQMLEIAKAVSDKARVLIMDEPTASLAAKEVETLFSLVHRMKEEGVCVVFISHRLDEVFEITDRITVLRDGHTIDSLNTSDTNREELIKLMVGRELTELYPERTVSHGPVVLEVKHLTGNGDSDISLSVREGEILGLGGLVGAGRTELAMMLMGMARITDGQVLIDGKEAKIHSPRDAIKNGIGLVAEDRRRFSLSTVLPIKWNISMAILKNLSKMGTILTSKEKEVVEHFKEVVRIKTPDVNNKVSSLSGGNQQKVAISKWLVTYCRVLIFDEPTQGVDVGARSEIYRIINEQCEAGKAVIMISSDMEELLGLSDRIIVMAEGKITGEIAKEDFSQELVLKKASNL